MPLYARGSRPAFWTAMPSRSETSIRRSGYWSGHRFRFWGHCAKPAVSFARMRLCAVGGLASAVHRKCCCASCIAGTLLKRRQLKFIVLL